MQVHKIADIFLHFPAGMLWIIERASNHVWQRVFWRGMFFDLRPLKWNVFIEDAFELRILFNIDRISKSISFN